MSSLVSLVASHGIIKAGDGSVAHPDDAVRAVQLALSQAGYRIGVDGVFGDGTLAAVRRFQDQHDIGIDGKVGEETAAKLDEPHDVLVSTATPRTVPVPVGPADQTSFPHDDTASLLAFYGKPWEDSSLLVPVPVPFALRYHDDGGRVIDFRQVQFHKRAADRLHAAFAAIWDAYGHDQSALDARHISWFSGTYNYRPIRGSSRLSCHAFGAAIDLDAEDNPLGATHSTLPPDVVTCFKTQGFFWGGDYLGRKDPMHFQAAHE